MKKPFTDQDIKELGDAMTFSLGFCLVLGLFIGSRISSNTLVVMFLCTTLFLNKEVKFYLMESLFEIGICIRGFFNKRIA